MDATAQTPPTDQPPHQQNTLPHPIPSGEPTAPDTVDAAAHHPAAPGALPWRTVAASVVGVSHQRSGHPLQDAYAVEISDGGVAVVAVADGAGSAARAERGSALAVRAAVAAAIHQLFPMAAEPGKGDAELDWRALFHAVFKQARGALEAEAVSQEAPLRDYATTLLVLVIAESHAACGLVGDCAAVVQFEDGQLLSLCAPQKGEYANMTNFLTQDHALARLDVHAVQQRVQCAAILSDGLLELALNVAHNRPHAPFFAPLFAFAHSADNTAQASAELATFLASDRINSRTHDDKTLILLSRGVEE